MAKSRILNIFKKTEKPGNVASGASRVSEPSSVPESQPPAANDGNPSAGSDNSEFEVELATPGHPISVLMGEHSGLLEYADELLSLSETIKNRDSHEAAVQEIKAVERLIGYFRESEKHYLREENVLFPSLEKHGIEGPPKVMWMEHEQIRAIKKKLYPLVDTAAELDFKEFARELAGSARALQQTLSGHFDKENSILFPMAMEALTTSEWDGVAGQFADIGYCSFSPGVSIESRREADLSSPAGSGEITFATGSLSAPILEAMLNTLPVEITYIDAEDAVKFFSQHEDMIFTRSKAVIGTKVQNCHPQKSLHLVERILKEFKSGERDVAEFWADFKGKKVHIRYFAVRDGGGKYLGCMEVAQDITQIQKIEGQKRLLD